MCLPHLYKWLATGGTVSRRTANKKLTKLYWPSWKRSPKRQIVFFEPKKWWGTTKNSGATGSQYFWMNAWMLLFRRNHVCWWSATDDDELPVTTRRPATASTAASVAVPPTAESSDRGPAVRSDCPASSADDYSQLNLVVRQSDVLKSVMSTRRDYNGGLSDSLIGNLTALSAQ